MVAIIHNYLGLCIGEGVGNGSMGQGGHGKMCIVIRERLCGQASKIVIKI